MPKHGSENTTHGVLETDMSEVWTRYVNAQLLDQTGYELLTEYIGDKDVEARLARLSGTKVSQVFKQLLDLKEPSVIRYVLALIDQALAARPGVGALFSEPAVFLKLLSNDDCVKDQFIVWKCCRIVSHLFVTIVDSQQHTEQVSEFITILKEKVAASQLEAFLFSAKLLLRRPVIRKLFAKNSGIVVIEELLKGEDVPVQVQYQSILCLWMLSFDADIAAEMTEIVPLIVRVARQSQKEKVVRISLAALRNVASHSDNIEKMVESKLNKQLEIWNNKRWGDEDIVNDLDYLTSTVNDTIRDMSSFERYKSEVLSGELEWSPVHTSEMFWRDNVTNLAENNFDLIRVLSQVLSDSSSSATSKAVACYDIGEFVRLHPHGRKVVTELGTKKTVMTFLEGSTDAELQKQALLCTRKMMVSNWEMLSLQK